MIEPLTLDIPFPTTEGISRDAFSLKIISPAYASAQSELNTILQYNYHAGFFERAKEKDISKTLFRISVCEMIHLNLLSKTIAALGAAPVYTRYPPDFFDFYSTKYVSYSRSLKHMLEDDILGEKRAIAGYEKMLVRLKNPGVIKIINRILEDEKLHLKTLENMRPQLQG